MQLRVQFSIFLLLLSLSATLAIEFMNVTVNANVFGATQYPGVIFQAGGDNIVVADHSPIDNNPYFRILRRNSSSQYDEIYRELLFATDVTTNGKWHGYLKSAYLDGGYHLFQLDADNNATNEHYFPDLTSGFGALLSDNSFVFANSTMIQTYVIKDGNWTLIQTIEVQRLVTYYKWSFHADSSIMSGLTTNAERTNGTILYWTRNADLTWSLAGSVDFGNNIYPNWARWNGGDTIFVGDPGNRLLRVYTKNSTDEWTYQNYPQTLAGITGVGYFPSSCVLVDANTAVLSAPQDGATVNDPRVGASVVMARGSGGWNFTTVFKADRNLYLFSAGLDINDYDLVFYSVVSAKTTTFYTLPLSAGTPNSSGNPPSNESNNPSSSNTPSSMPRYDNVPVASTGFLVAMPSLVVLATIWILL